MPRFRYIVADLFNGILKGTDDEPSATQYAESEDYFVYDTQKDVWLDSSGTERPIEEAPMLMEGDGEEEQDEELEEDEDEEEEFEDEDEEEDPDEAA